MTDFQVSYANTPNPQSLKFSMNHKVCDQKIEFKERQSAERSPIALKILGFPWAKSVFLGEDFITITKEDWVEWDIISEPIRELIAEHFNQGGQALLPKKEELSSDDSEEVKKIKDILKQDIQPAVAMDGGYIEFVSYKEGIVYLSLQGACAGCPSSTITLKQGIEARLKQFLPDIKEVVDV